jgi:hypothetical protein
VDLISEDDLLDIETLSNNLGKRMAHLHILNLWLKNKVWVSL